MCRHPLIPPARDVHAALGARGGPLVSRNGHIPAAGRCDIRPVTFLDTDCDSASKTGLVRLSVLAWENLASGKFKCD